jgi:hypothetical protein
MKGKRIAAILLLVSPASLAQQPESELAAAPLERQPNILSTRAGLEIGAQASHYQYAEPGLMSLTGNRVGVVGTATLAGQSRAFLRLEFRDSYARLRYDSSGTGSKSDVPDWLLELRGLAGLDFIGARAALSPYLGLGYRYLYNDLRGYTSTGAGGYRRYSNYLYAPVGLTARWHMGEGWVLAPTLEADVFLAGKQITKASDLDPRLMDATNDQHSGHGYRGSLMIEKGSWMFGVWTQYWHIQSTDFEFVGVVNGQSVFLKEPENTTRETGIELRYRF